MWVRVAREAIVMQDVVDDLMPQRAAILRLSRRPPQVAVVVDITMMLEVKLVVLAVAVGHHTLVLLREALSVAQARLVVIQPLTLISPAVVMARAFMVMQAAVLRWREQMGTLQPLGVAVLEVLVTVVPPLQQLLKMAA
jgi:hypothetical protein